ncbi:hypothetical protein [Paenibacillus koleovorans]|uniref:hypothetical protein n=1 Tax=Paenibacillus koleovorans TaxID=121608 RepID=UPI001FE2AAD9|nr:hypothetical protein [Paenibacillus koleovorans]
MKRWRNVIYMSLALIMLIYAVPRLEMGSGWTLPTVAGVVWIALALTVVAAHLHRILGVDETQEDEARQVRQVARMRRQQWLQRQVDRQAGRK